MTLTTHVKMMQLNFIILLDDMLAREFQNFQAYYNVSDLSKPYSVSSDLTLSACVTDIIGQFLSNNVNTNRLDIKDSIFEHLTKLQVEV